MILKLGGLITDGGGGGGGGGMVHVDLDFLWYMSTFVTRENI